MYDLLLLSVATSSRPAHQLSVVMLSAVSKYSFGSIKQAYLYALPTMPRMLIPRVILKARISLVPEWLCRGQRPPWSEHLPSICPRAGNKVVLCCATEIMKPICHCNPAFPTNAPRRREINDLPKILTTKASSGIHVLIKSPHMALWGASIHHKAPHWTGSLSSLLSRHELHS